MALASTLPIPAATNPGSGANAVGMVVVLLAVVVLIVAAVVFFVRRRR
jgi:hypothetical protein